MKTASPRLLALLGGIAVAAWALADSDEAEIVRATLPADTRPLLALILDTSRTEPVLVREPFDPARTYGDSLSADERCEPTRIYWRRGPGPVPDCLYQAGLEHFPADALRGLQCGTARQSLESMGFHVAARAAQWRVSQSGGDWTALREAADGAVECVADADIALAWDRSPLGDPYTFYTGNYLNWLRSTEPDIETPYREALGHSLATLRATTDLEVAWFRVAHDGSDGAWLAGAPMPASQAAEQLADIAAEQPVAGPAPLAESLVESALWLAGEDAQFGATEAASPQAFEEAAPGRYRSPFEHPCRPVTLAFITQARPSSDDFAGSAAAGLPGFVAGTGGCDADCLATVANWIDSADLRVDQAGTQSAALHFLESQRIENPLAVAELAAQSFQRDAAVPAPPHLSAPAFIASPDPGRPSDVVFALSVPRATARWSGNLFRYSLRAADAPLVPPAIVDRDGEPAIGAESLPLPGSRSLWSDSPDADLLSGGAAGRIAPAAARELFTELGGAEITAASNRLVATNPAVRPSLLGLGQNDTEGVVQVLDSLANERRLGDFGSNAPVVAGYPDRERRIVFATNHDGWLQAFDADSGAELWAWMPLPLLPRLPRLVRNQPTTVRDHGIDGALVLHRHDPDGDGRIDANAGEHYWLLFGLGRGGNRYYALDVADPDLPRLIWSFELPGDAALESRAEPVVTRIALDGSNQNEGRWVALLAGGYDRRFDSAEPAAADPASALHLVDAESGALLWSAGEESGSALALGDADASFGSAPRALDLDGDGLLDRAYTVDVAGSLWRFDFASGRAPAELAQARRVARLGTGPQRFYGTPDVSLSRSAGGVRLAVSIGSGWVARPLDVAVVDRVYTVFDVVNGALPGTVVEADLHDAGAAPDAMPAAAPGWLRRLDSHGSGEKTIGPTITFNGALHLQTWQPLPVDAAAPCGPPQGVRRRYELDVLTGRAHRVALESPEEEAIELPGSGLPVALRFGFPGDAGVGCPGCRPHAFGIAGAGLFDSGYAADPVRTSWRKLAPPPASH